MSTKTKPPGITPGSTVNIPIGIGPMRTSSNVPSESWGTSKDALTKTPEKQELGNIRWTVDKGVRADIVAFSGLNLSGKRTLVRIFAYGGRQGDELNTADLSSVAVVAPVGTRVVFSTALDGEDYAGHAWRSVSVLKDQHYETNESRAAVRIPDLDALNDYDARRVDPDYVVGYPRFDNPDGSDSWSFGGQTRETLKGQVRHIRLVAPPKTD